MSENNKRNMAYIKVHKSFTKTMESKLEDYPTYNVFKLPQNVVVGDVDLSHGILNPIVMREDKYNKNMMVACYDKDKLEDNSVMVNVKDGDEYKKIKVDVDVLSEKVKEANIEYLNRKKEKEHENSSEEKSVEKEKSFSIAREKEHEFTY